MTALIGCGCAVLEVASIGLVMRRSGVRFPEAAPGRYPLSMITFRQGATFIVRSLVRPCPRGAPEPLGRVPQIAVDHVPVQVHRHGSCGVPQYSLDHFRISARRQPHRSRRVAQIVNAQLGPPNRRLCLTPTDRPLPVRFPQRTARRRGEEPFTRALTGAPPIHEGTTTGTSGTVRARLFFNVSTYNSPPPLLARTARDNRSPGRAPSPGHQPAGRPAHPTEGLASRVRRSAPLRASARLSQSHHFIEVEEPAFAPRLPPGRSFRRRGSIHRHSAVRHRKRQQRSEGGQCSRRRRPSKATSHQFAKPARDVCRSDRCHWPTPEPRSDVVPPRPAVAFQCPTFYGAPRLQPPFGDHIQRHLASTASHPSRRIGQSNPRAVLSSCLAPRDPGRPA